MLDTEQSPKWLTANRKSHLIALFERSKGFCVFGEKPCSNPELHHYGYFIEDLITEWKADDRATIEALWKAESRAIHRLGERRFPVRGRFSNIAKDIYYAEQPQFYIIGLSISGLTFEPFASVRLSSSYLHLFVSLGDTLKTLSKNKRRKAIRYSKELPKAIEDRVNIIIRQAVEDFFSFSH